MSRDVRPRIFDEDGSTISQSNIGEYINRHVTLDQGYKVLVRRYRATNQKKLTKTNANATIGLRCWRGRKSESTKGANKTESNTKLSQEDDDVCDWFIPAYYDAEDDVVYFKQHCNACFEHKGHPHIKREHMKLGASDIPEETRKTAESLLGKNCPPSVVQLLLSVLSGDRITQDAIAQMRRAVLISKHDQKTGESTADSLLNLLEAKPGTTYCYMTGSYDEALGKVRVRKGTCVSIYISAYLHFCVFTHLRIFQCFLVLHD